MVTWKTKNTAFIREQEEGQRRFYLLKIRSKRLYGLIFCSLFLEIWSLDTTSG